MSMTRRVSRASRAARAICARHRSRWSPWRKIGGNRRAEATLVPRHGLQRLSLQTRTVRAVNA